MSKSINQLLAESDPFELCESLFHRILEKYGPDFDIAEVGPEERVVALVCHVNGIIGNGGFRHLFEGDLKGDPEYGLTFEAFRAIGCRQAIEAFRQTLALFPDSRPPQDANKRLKLYLKRIKGWPTEQDLQFFAANEDLYKCLAEYIRANSEAFRRLDQTRPMSQKTPKPAKQKHPKKPTSQRLADLLPHWARVAFAARCARHVYPLIEDLWEEFAQDHLPHLKEAVELAEISAELGKAEPGLNKAITNALMAAGAALMAGSTLPGAGPAPKNGWVANIVSMIAKSAEKAAEAARTTGEESAFAVLEANSYAKDAAIAAKESEIVERIEEEFRFIRQAARSNAWSDETPVPADVWALL